MKMPITMLLARQRAISIAYNETGEVRPCNHCGSNNSENHARARHETQCGDRFEALGLPKDQGMFIPTTWTQASARQPDSSMLIFFQGLCRP